MLTFSINLIEDYTKNLEHRLRELEKTETFVGYKESQGFHASGLTYPDLIALHAAGVPSKNIPSRDIFGVANMEFNPSSKGFKKSLTKYLSGISKKNPPIKATIIAKKWAESYGDTLLPIFGNTAQLAHNTPYTQTLKARDGVSPANNPLVWTGELKSSLGYWIDDNQFKY